MIPLLARLAPSAAFRYSHGFRVSCALLAMAVVTLPAVSAVLEVAPVPGSAPYATVQAALDAAKPGDTVLLGPGIYRERVRFTRGGERGAPVTLEGRPGAIIDGSTPVELKWVPAPDIAPGVWRAPLDFFPFTVTANGQVITTLNEKRTAPLTQKEKDAGTQRSILWPDAFRDGIRRSGWDGVRALAMYRQKERELIVRFQHDLDPREMNMTVAPREPVVLIDGVDRAVVRGVTLRNSAIGVQIANSLGSVVEQTTIDPADYGIVLEAGADRATLRFNRITLNPYAGANPWRRGSWDDWQAHKIGGFWDRIGIKIGRTLGGHHIHDNHIHDHWDGIDDHGNPPWGPQDNPPADNPGLRVHHNLIENLNDDGMETMGPGVNGEWHHNIIRRTRCGFRIKAPHRGPLYLHHNIFFENKEDFRNWAQGDQFYPEAEVWVYHNTSTSDPAVTMNYKNTPTPPSATGYRYYNNLFWNRQWVLKKDEDPAPDWRGDYNVYLRVTPEYPRPAEGPAGTGYDSPYFTNRHPTEEQRIEVWNAGREQARAAGLEANSHWQESGAPGFRDAAAYDLSLTFDGPARGRGLDLSTLADAPKPFPGLPAGYFTGERPDVGALQFGESMPVLPRRHQEVDTTPASYWP